MIKKWFVRFVFFLDRHRIWAYLGSLVIILALLSHRILPLILSGSFRSPEDMFMAVIMGFIIVPMFSMFACKVVLDMLTEAIMKPKIAAASEREKPVTLKTSQASDPRFEGAFTRDEVELKYSKAKFEQINEDHMGISGRWKLYWRSRRVLKRWRKK